MSVLPASAARTPRPVAQGPVFLITIDTEGDNIWARRTAVTTENVRWLPRFQALCGQYGFPPTYLTSYEMAIDPRFRRFARAAVRRGAAEVGLHVHAWYSPPRLSARGSAAPHVYIYELPASVMHAQMEMLTGLLSDAVDVRPVSHRAGKWGFNEQVARLLVDLGYLVDCSVTPGISWARYRSAPEAPGGPDFQDCPTEPYFVDLENVRRPGNSPLLEIPVTVRPNNRPGVRRLYRTLAHRRMGGVIRRVLGAPHGWLRPNGRNLHDLLGIADWSLRRQRPVLELALHSSELMPGGSPTVPTPECVERLFDHLQRLFAHLAERGVTGMTLAEYRRRYPLPHAVEE